MVVQAFIPSPGRQKQDDLHKFEATPIDLLWELQTNRVYIMRPCIVKQQAKSNLCKQQRQFLIF